MATDDRDQRRTRDTDDLELREEELTARKERTKAGKAEIEKDVVTERRAADVPVTHEEVTVTRRAGGSATYQSAD